ncbi:MAG: TolC family protein [Flavobacteriaceae bacterium]|nr:TolC family protein [Flavobacteriaceae bacterium]
MNRLIAGLFIILSWNSYAQLSLSLCQEKAKANFPMIIQYDLINQAQDYSLNNAKKNYYPQLSFTAIGGIIDGLPTVDGKANGQFVALTQFNQLIWDGGITKGQKEIIKGEINQQSAEIDRQFYELRHRVNEIYFAILLLEYKQQAATSYLKILKSQESKLNTAIENQLVLNSDKQELDIAKLKAEQELTEIEIVSGQYRSLLGHLIGESVEQSTSLIYPDERVFSLVDSYTRPELKVYQAQIEQLEAQKSFNSSFLYPKLGITGIMVNLAPEIGLGPAEINNLFLGGLSLSWNIDGLFRNKNKNALVDVKIARIQNQVDQFEFNVALSAYKDQASIMTYQTRYEQSKKIAELKEQVANTYQNKYDNGTIGMAELIQNLEEVSIAKSEVEANHLNYLKAIYQYNYTTGKNE